RRLSWELLAIDVVTGVATEVDEHLPSNNTIACGWSEPPSRGHPAGLMQRHHTDRRREYRDFHGSIRRFRARELTRYGRERQDGGGHADLHHATNSFQQLVRVFVLPASTCNE